MSSRLRSVPFALCALMLACSEREPGTSSTSGGVDESGTTAVTADLPTSSGADATGEPATTGTTTGVTTTMTGETTTGASDDLVLDPATLEFFDLPIDSLRYAVGGFDPDHGLCAAIIFSDPGAKQHCDDFMVGASDGFPYVVITPAAAPPCMDWDYVGNVQLDAASGCFQVLAPFPADVAIDMKLQVSGAAFTGKIVVASE